MPIITKIAPQKSKKRVNIYLDGAFGFGLDLENFVVLHLKEGKELSENEITEIVKRGEFAKVSDKLLRFAMMRPRSEKEYKDWLRKYKVHESLYEELFAKLKRLELLDDVKFAKWWVGQRREFKPRSKSALQFELMQKGIPKDVIKIVLSETNIDETILALEIAEKKRRKWDGLPKEETKKKIQMILANRGFGWDVTKKVIEKLLH